MRFVIHVSRFEVLQRSTRTPDSGPLLMGIRQEKTYANPQQVQVRLRICEIYPVKCTIRGFYALFYPYLILIHSAVFVPGVVRQIGEPTESLLPDPIAPNIEDKVATQVSASRLKTILPQNPSILPI